MAAAVCASEGGRSVTVLDDNPTPGGQIWRGGYGSTWFKRFAASKVEMITGAQVLSAQRGSRTLIVEQEGRTRRAQFRTLILATGARELFLPFPGWTLPGVIGVGGLQAMAKSGMPVAGKRIVVAGSGPLLLAVAAHLRERGARIVLIAEQASRESVAKFAAGLWRYPEKIKEAVVLRTALGTVPYWMGAAVTTAAGEGKLEEVTFIQGGRRSTVPCDYAAIAYGLCPNTELAAALGCTITEQGVSVDMWQQTSVPDVFCAGECTGIGGVDLSLAEGQIAGYVAAGHNAAAERLFGARRKARHFADALNAAFALRPEIKKLTRPETIVCRCEDVPLARLQDMPSFRAAKLQTRCGMGPCQGRVCGPAVRLLFGWNTDTVRPPTFPARIGSFILEGEKDA